MVKVGIKKALEHVSKVPQLPDEDQLQTPAWELVTRSLFWIANNPDERQRGSMARATRAQKLILNRLVGTRRPGSHPAARASAEIEFYDLTMGALP